MIQRIPRAALWALLCAVLSGCAGAPPVEHGLGDLRLDEIQVIGSHNSYKAAIDPEQLAMMLQLDPGARALDYAHLSLTDQLNLGLRNLELDVYHDPQGGSYANPFGLRLLRAAGSTPSPFDPEGHLSTPGFKVMHDAEFDFRSHKLRLEDALDELAAWSDRNPGHLVIFVTMNCKRGPMREPGKPPAADFDVAAMDRLDRAVSQRLGARRLFTPDDLRRDEPTIAAGLARHGWPRASQAAGRFLFALDEGGQTRANYLFARPGARGGAFFPVVDLGSPEAAFYVLNDPRADAARIAAALAAGGIVRTRADAGTEEARQGDTSRFNAALASGAQVITTDYYIPDRSIPTGYMIRFPDGGFARARPPRPAASPDPG